MHRFTTAIRQPVRRPGSETYLLITLLSFAGSVTLTRLFLNLTGFPQVGNGELHIAHVLWGGLLLFIAGLLPLIFANRWVYTIGAVLSGAGVGLFIDEVGKFITQSNDYFFPLAAPIIYAFFLLTVMLYLRVRRAPARQPRIELYFALDALEEVLEHDLDAAEKTELAERLTYVANQQEQPVLARLAKEILEVVQWDLLELSPPRPSFLQRLLARWRNFETRSLDRSRLTILLVAGLVGLGIAGLWNMAISLPHESGQAGLSQLIQRLIATGQLRSSSSVSWYVARLALETSVGLMFLVSAAFLAARRDRIAMAFAYPALLLSLTAVNLLVFYFDQFSTIVLATVQLVILLGVLYYRQKYLQPPKQA